MWLPWSAEQVSQAPLRKNPVIGAVEHVASVLPSTLNDGSFSLEGASRELCYDMAVGKEGSRDAAPFDPTAVKICAAQINRVIAGP